MIWVPGRQCAGRRGWEGRWGGCGRRWVAGLGRSGGGAGRYCRGSNVGEVWLRLAVRLSRACCCGLAGQQHVKTELNACQVSGVRSG